MGSRCPFQLPALLAETLEIRISRFYRVATLLANEPAFQFRQHRPEVIAQNAIRTTNDPLSHWALFLMRTAQYLTSAWPRPWYENGDTAFITTCHLVHAYCLRGYSPGCNESTSRFPRIGIDLEVGWHKPFYPKSAQTVRTVVAVILSLPLFRLPRARFCRGLGGLGRDRLTFICG